jgi:hypothetical protein
LHEVGGAELGGSTRGLDRLGQTDCFTFPELHRKSTLILLVLYFNAGLFIVHRRVTEERASAVAKAQPEADPPPAEMDLCLEEACKLVWQGVEQGKNASL